MKILYLPNELSQQRQHSKKRWIYPVLLAMQAQFYKLQGETVHWGIREGYDYDKVITEPENIPFLELPRPDRLFTDAFNPKYKNNGNFLHRPGTYFQVANGCWFGQCSFCVEQNNTWEVRELEDVEKELWECHKLGFREAFDDSGTFPIGTWLQEFCRLKLPPITLGCNMRMVDVDYKLMKKAGFRMLLFGLESANQSTLNIINKGTKVEDVKYIIRASQAGLDCHICAIFGFPWESDDDAIRTLELVHRLLKKGYARTAQASFYDVKNEQGDENHRKYIKRIYEVGYSPQFWFNQLTKIHGLDDIKYILRGIKEALK